MAAVDFNVSPELKRIAERRFGIKINPRKHLDWTIGFMLGFGSAIGSIVIAFIIARIVVGHW